MPQFDTDRRAVLERMREANVTQAVIVATEEREIELVEALAKDQEGLFTAFAVSPQDETLPELTAEEIAQRMLRPKMVAVGETGLDYHYCHEPLDWQRRRFGTHIDAAKIAPQTSYYSFSRGSGRYDCYLKGTRCSRLWFRFALLLRQLGLCPTGS